MNKAADLYSNERTSALLRPGPSILILVWGVRFVAVINLISTFIGHKPKLIHHLAHWVPFELSEGRHFRMFLMAILLFVLASGLKKGKRLAWLLTIATLALAPILHIGRAVIWPQLLLNIGIIGFLLYHHRYFVARSDPRSVRFALLICPTLALVLLIFGSIRLHELRFQTSGGDDWISCIQTACELVLAHETHTQQAQTQTTFDFFSILRMGGTSIGLMGLILTLRPVLIRRRVQGENHEKVKKIIDEYGFDPLDPYALLNDKRYFFSPHDDRTVVPYVLSGDFAVALANPIGPADSQPFAIAEFALFCRHQGLEPVFYQVTEELLSSYQWAGFSLFKIGEETRIKADEFYLKGTEFQNLRTACNRARKLDIHFHWYDPAKGLDIHLEHQLADVSHRWLGQKRKEMTFDMGAYNVANIRANGAAVALNCIGKVLAFATWRPFNQGKGQTLDLMRSLPGERNIMDFVLVESITRFRKLGIKDISLGSAPLANTRKETTPLVAEERAVQFLYENLNRLYGYKSLFEFKRKYRPEWRGRYVAYRRGAHLPLVGLALVRIHAPEGIVKFMIG